MVTQSNIPIELATLYAMFDEYLDTNHGKDAADEFDTVLNLLWNKTLLSQESAGENLSIRSCSYLDDVLIDGCLEADDTDFDAIAKDVNILAMAGNYRELSREEIKEYVDAMSIENINISTDLDSFEHLHIYVKGEKELAHPESKIHQKARQYFEVIRGNGGSIRRVVPQLKYIPQTYKIFRSVIVLYKQKPIDYIISQELSYGNEKKAGRIRNMLSYSSYLNNIYDSVALKLRKRGIKEEDFGKTGIILGKGVPSSNLEFLLPQSKIILGLGERLKIGLTGGAKPTFAVLSSFLKKKMLTYGAASLTLGLSAAKSVATYFNARSMIKDQVRRLTFDYLAATGKHVFSPLADEAEREITKELGLAYHMLYSQMLDGNCYVHRDDVETNVERFVRLKMPGDNYGFKFHTDEVLDTMCELGIARRQGDSYRAVSPQECIPIIENMILKEARNRPGGNELSAVIRKNLKTQV